MNAIDRPRSSPFEQFARSSGAGGADRQFGLCSLANHGRSAHFRRTHCAPKVRTSGGRRFREAFDVRPRQVAPNALMEDGTQDVVLIRSVEGLAGCVEHCGHYRTDARRLLCESTPRVKRILCSASTSSQAKDAAGIPSAMSAVLNCVLALMIRIRALSAGDSGPAECAEIRHGRCSCLQRRSHQHFCPGRPATCAAPEVRSTAYEPVGVIASLTVRTECRAPLRR